LRIALAQINSAVGDLSGNANRILQKTREARVAGADVVVFPELALTGYPPEDLLLKPQFISDNMTALRDLARKTEGLLSIVGFVESEKGKIYNAAAILRSGRVLGTYRKCCLPNYGVFDEKRYFAPGSRPRVINVNGHRLGLSICEDIWVDDGPVRRYGKMGVDLLINLSASPYFAGKIRDRWKLMAKWTRLYKTSGAYVNLVGGQDELVFDGGSFFMNSGGRVVANIPQFEESMLVVDTRAPALSVVPKLKSIEEIKRALVLGTRDYVNKNRFSKVALGVSGGIDSGLVSALAVEALGKDRVIGVTMPSRFTSGGTFRDSRTLARNLGIRLITLPIQSLVKAYGATLKNIFKGMAPNIAEENLQARIRGTLLMALSNKFGWLILTTGNKSEISTGYCTLYGDTAGGFAVIKDVPKTMVYQLAEHINREAGWDMIPRSMITRAPTAELKANQKDQDTLPPYAALDRLIKAYVEEDRPMSQILRRGVDEPTMRKVIRMVDLNEYKRRQAPPGIKITPKAFGRDRRMPITNLYKP
jgi:NAD+ synthase (glutamine-hydrolysing)